MTIRDFITSKFQSFGIQLSEADLAETGLTVDLDAELTKDNQKDVYTVLANVLIPFLLLRPSNINEQGFSVSFDRESLLRFYAWLCDLLGIDDVLNKKSKMIDRSDLW